MIRKTPTNKNRTYIQLLMAKRSARILSSHNDYGNSTPLFLVEADTILHGVHVTCFYTPLLCALTPHSLPEYTYHLPRTRK